MYDRRSENIKIANFTLGLKLHEEPGLLTDHASILENVNENYLCPDVLVKKSFKKQSEKN